MRPARPLPFGFAVAGGRQRCSAWEWNNHSLHLAPWRPSRHGKRCPAGYCEHALGYRAIRRHGVWRGYLILRRRLEKCGIAHRRLQKRRAYLQTQAGFCDLSCDIPCDLDAFDIVGEACDCSCDWPSRKERSGDKEVHLPAGR